MALEMEKQVRQEATRMAVDAASSLPACQPSWAATTTARGSLQVLGATGQARQLAAGRHVRWTGRAATSTLLPKSSNGDCWVCAVTSEMVTSLVGWWGAVVGTYLLPTWAGGLKRPASIPYSCALPCLVHRRHGPFD